MPKIYLDTCIVSGLLENARNYIPEIELNALETLVDQDDLELVTSPKLLEEVTRTGDNRRRKHLRILFKMMKKVYAPPPTITSSGIWGDAVWGSTSFGGGTTTWKDPIFAQLEAIFDQEDAHHIFIAHHTGCDFFLTRDVISILDRVFTNTTVVSTAISPMKIIRAVDLIKQLPKSPRPT